MGPDLDDPIIIRRVPTTYVYPTGTGRLELGEGTFSMEPPLPLIESGTFLAILEETPRTYEKNLPYLYHKEVKYGEFRTKLLINRYTRDGALSPHFRRFPYTWIGVTLKLEWWHYPEAGFIYESYWTRENFR